MSKLNAKQHIDIELSLDELDLTSAERKSENARKLKYPVEKEKASSFVTHGK